jgi:hypothetical protein
MDTINELFDESNTTETTTNMRQLKGTAQLTTKASELAVVVLKAVDADLETYREMFKASKASHESMDQLISATVDLEVVDVRFLDELSEDDIAGMLKSQQSKRSRSKGKLMTMENYRAMLVGAIAENLIRTECKMPKQSGGSRRAAGTSEYTEEQLVELAADQSALRKAIRNVQSKKSIAKSKIGFSETSDAWKDLLHVEAQLKGLRTDSAVIEVDSTKNALADLMQDVDVNSLKASDSKELLAKIRGILG